MFLVLIQEQWRGVESTLLSSIVGNVPVCVCALTVRWESIGLVSNWIEIYEHISLTVMKCQVSYEQPEKNKTKQKTTLADRCPPR